MHLSLQMCSLHSKPAGVAGGLAQVLQRELNTVAQRKRSARGRGDPLRVTKSQLCVTALNETHKAREIQEGVAGFK